MEIGIETPREHKYKILKEAKNSGLTITFDVLYNAKNWHLLSIIEEIGKKEGELIRINLPPLNYQIPREDDYKHFTVNRSALTITLQELLEKENKDG